MNILNVEKVSKTYGEKQLFDEVTLGVNKGDKIGVIGVNGTGKSTFLKIIAGLEEADAGQVVKGKGVTVAIWSRRRSSRKRIRFLATSCVVNSTAVRRKRKQFLQSLALRNLIKIFMRFPAGRKKELRWQRHL